MNNPSEFKKMLTEINMDSLLSIQDQYLSAVATLLSAGQQQQKQKMIGIPKHKPIGINSRGRKQQPRLQLVEQTRQPQATSSTIVSPLDLSTKRSATSSPTNPDESGVVDHLSSLLKIIPQSASQPLNLAVSGHQPPPPRAQSISSSSCSASSPVYCSSFSRPSSTNSLSYQARFQDQSSFSPNGPSESHHSTISSDRLITSSNGLQQKLIVASSSSSSGKKSSKATKSHLCEHCGRSFSRSDMLTRHSRLHSGLKPYQCDQCHQVFSRSDHLSTHERTHTGEKPYQCKFCSYSACRRDMITRHMRTHSTSATVNSNDAIVSKSSSSRNRPRQQSNARKAQTKLVSVRLALGRPEQGEDGDVSTSTELSIEN